LPEVICDTSPLQYLHQIGHLQILPFLAGRVIVPAAVEEELATGRRAGVDLPDPRTLDWVTVKRPTGRRALPPATDLGAGETEVLMIALESVDPIVVLDDGLARSFAESLNIRLTGTIGLLLDAKRAGLVEALTPLLDQLQSLGFRLSPHTRRTVLRLAGEGGA
jgi:predicted nucleic acid-binding protein